MFHRYWFYSHNWLWHQGQYRYSRPSRLLWFILGAATVKAWNYHQEARLYYANKRYWGNCFRAPIQVPNYLPHSSLQSSLEAKRPTDTAPRWRQQSSPWDDCEAQWERDKARLLELVKYAQDTAADLSESTLDSILTTVESLKAKLAEHRAQREKQLLEPRKHSPQTRWT
ncbi:hypothetical protein C8J56DRAFT_1055052 [Mycena floridula]|nr:hypothetical protein C8J56DRAFT_1055052 [Mycena floridula]